MAGVSAATVSRVLSGSTHPVRVETRARVMSAARELDFHPNMLARGLATARTQTAGAIVHDIADPYFGEVVRGLEDAANQRDYRVFVCSSDRNASRELAYVKALLAYRVDIIAFAGGGIEDRGYQRELARLLGSFEAQGGAVVLLAPHAYRAPGIVTDNRGGAEAMTRYLLSLGHRRISFVTGPSHIRTSALRLAGYRSALAERGIAVDPSLVVEGHFTTEGGVRAAAELMESDHPPSAIFAANDVTALGVLHELWRRGVRIPEDVSVAGFDDIEMAAYAHTPLTTVHVPMYELGTQGMAAALEILAGGRPRSRRLPTEVIERASTASTKVRS